MKRVMKDEGFERIRQRYQRVVTVHALATREGKFSITPGSSFVF